MVKSVLVPGDDGSCQGQSSLLENSEANLVYSDKMSVSFNCSAQYEGDHEEGGKREKSHLREQSRVTGSSILDILVSQLFCVGLFVSGQFIEQELHVGFEGLVPPGPESPFLPPQGTRPCSDGPIS